MAAEKSYFWAEQTFSITKVEDPVALDITTICIDPAVMLSVGSPPPPSSSSGLLQSWIPGSHLGLRGSVSARSKVIMLSNALHTLCSNGRKGRGRSQLLLCSSFCCSGRCPCPPGCCRAASVLTRCSSAVAVFLIGLCAEFSSLDWQEEIVSHTESKVMSQRHPVTRWYCL